MYCTIYTHVKYVRVIIYKVQYCWVREIKLSWLGSTFILVTVLMDLAQYLTQ